MGAMCHVTSAERKYKSDKKVYTSKRTFLNWYWNFTVRSYLTLDRRRWERLCPETGIREPVARTPVCAGVQETKYHETSLWHPTWPYPALMWDYISNINICSFSFLLLNSSPLASTSLSGRLSLPASTLSHWGQPLCEDQLMYPQASL